jgi:hypothetical protein
MNRNHHQEDLLGAPCTLTRAELASIIHSVDSASRLFKDLAVEHSYPTWKYDEDLRFEELQAIKRTCIAALNQGNLLDPDPTRPPAS